MSSFSWLGVITIASIEKDKQRLAELFASVARIPKPKMEKALKDNDIRDLIKNPGLLSPTIAELERIELLQEYRQLYTTLSHFETKYKITTPEDAAIYLEPTLAERDHEVVVSLLLDTRNNVIKQLVVADGQIDSAMINPRKIVRDALLYNAKAMILAHNHPSGDPKPSQDDINATTNLTGILSTMGITVLDHIVIGRNDFSSLKQLGMFPGMQQSIREQDVKYGTRSSKGKGKCR